MREIFLQSPVDTLSQLIQFLRADVRQVLTDELLCSLTAERSHSIRVV